MVLQKIREAWRTRRIKKEHEKYLREHGIHPVSRLREHSERADPEWSKKVWEDIEKLHRKNIGSLWYRPSDEERKEIERLAMELHEKVAPRVDEKEWKAIMFGLQKYEEPYKTLGKMLAKLQGEKR